MFKFLEKYGISHHLNIKFNPTNPLLIEDAIKFQNASLSNHGALLVATGENTGRSAKDKYLVKDQVTSQTIDWSHDLNVLESTTFNEIKKWAIGVFNSINDRPLYYSLRSAGAHAEHHVNAFLLTTGASHSLFFNHMFRPSQIELSKLKAEDAFQIFHLPYEKIDAKKFNLKSNKGLFIDIAQKEVIIVGTAYAGEIKKSIFSIMNYFLPEKNILPMHAGANITDKGVVSAFFGLSGTGKTTLSTDENTFLIGDDEHGISPDGIFNFENGCYAKTYNLNKDSEPDIYQACESWGTIIENVKFNPETRVIDFADKTITENGRASYPLSAIHKIKEDAKAPMPKNLFFLSADAFGVLPPVSKLNNEQAMYYFLSGYTAKLAGTEIGVTTPTAAFSTCFGGPFMMRHPNDYAKLLGKYLNDYPIDVWLINTGWTGGAYGEGKRFPIKETRNIIRSIQNGLPKDTVFEKEEYFGLSIPKSLPNVDSQLLNPIKTWKNPSAYSEQAWKLSEMFHDNFKKYHNIDASILAGAPLKRK